MVLLKRKKGQAAIEFLMTYGWMLLVVLIVGALIFSFVDFGSLLPNQLTLSNNLRADATQMVASQADSSITIVFSYIGTREAKIDPSKVIFTSDTGYSCNASTGSGSNLGVTVKNLDIKTNATSASGKTVTFINGQLGEVKAYCPSSKLIQGDTFQGSVSIPVTSVRTDLTVISTGRLRLKVDQ